MLQSVHPLDGKSKYLIYQGNAGCQVNVHKKQGKNMGQIVTMLHFLKKCSIFRLPVNLRSADRNEDV